jgi:hypothetical protein
LETDRSFYPHAFDITILFSKSRRRLERPRQLSERGVFKGGIGLPPRRQQQGFLPNYDAMHSSSRFFNMRKKYDIEALSTSSTL